MSGIRNEVSCHSQLRSLLAALRSALRAGRVRRRRQRQLDADRAGAGARLDHDPGAPAGRLRALGPDRGADRSADRRRGRSLPRAVDVRCDDRRDRSPETARLQRLDRAAVPGSAHLAPGLRAGGLSAADAGHRHGHDRSAVPDGLEAGRSPRRIHCASGSPMRCRRSSSCRPPTRRCRRHRTRSRPTSTRCRHTRSATTAICSRRSRSIRRWAST